MVKLEALMAKGVVAPCIGCTRSCEPEKCELLGEWIKLLIDEYEMEEH
ncbi:MAG: hypothetical protein OD814_001104 [Candidatus Alkanophagales archaeon MCA70_species_1]|nr:hypothetical protein [Candidatus Alkanophaga volatiphilum]